MTHAGSEIAVATHKKLLVVYHTMTGGTQQMAEAAVRGAAAESSVHTRLLRAPDATPDDVVAADGLLFATPENLASMSGLMKDFFDRCYYPVLDRITGRPYAAMVCAGSDGEGAVRQLERIALGWRLKPVAAPLIVITHAQSPERILQPKTIGEGDLLRCEELGGMLAAGLALGIF
jgi:NAD(P)H-dependent FMN reductase